MGRTQLNLRMDEDRKEEWSEYADQSRWSDNLTDFVKEAVREKIERMDGGGEGGDFDVEVDTSGAESGEVLERLQNLRNDMQDLASEVGGAVDAVHAQSGVDPDVSPDVYQALPTGEDDAMTTEDIADMTGYKQATVRFALENMRREMGTVKRLIEMEDPETGETTIGHGEPENVAGYRTNTDLHWYKAEGA